MDNPENMKHWQRGLINYKLLFGSKRQVGAIMRLKYKIGKRKISLIETITKRNFPTEFHATYERKGVYNIQKNYFIKINENTTKWISDSEFLFSSILMKGIGFFSPNSFKKQSLIYAEDFKAYAEKGISVFNT